VAEDLRHKANNVDALLAALDPKLQAPIILSAQEFQDLVVFVRTDLLDPRARPENLRRLIPERLPSSNPVADFERPARGH
jgi:hypothetical protein